MPERALNTLLLGGCMLRWPITRTDKAEGKLAWEHYGRIGEIHTFGEIFQTIGILRGEVAIPAELKTYAHIHRKLQPLPLTERRFENVDLVLLGPSSPIELMFRGVSINRTALVREISAQVQDDTGWGEKLVGRWFRIGLVGLNETVREEAGEKLLGYIRGDSEEAELARAVVLETRSALADLGAGFSKIRQMFKCPMGLVLYIFRYMPDGRPISWPAGFRENILGAAAAFDVPVLDPSPMVVDYGVKEALLSGLSHYSKEFLPVIGEKVVKFAEDVYEGGSGAAMDSTSLGAH